MKLIRKILKICVFPLALILDFGEKWIKDLFDLMQESVYDFESGWCSFECWILNLWVDVKNFFKRNKRT